MFWCLMLLNFFVFILNFFLFFVNFILSYFMISMWLLLSVVLYEVLWLFLFSILVGVLDSFFVENESVLFSKNMLFIDCLGECIFCLIGCFGDIFEMSGCLGDSMFFVMDGSCWLLLGFVFFLFMLFFDLVFGELFFVGLYFFFLEFMFFLVVMSGKVLGVLCFKLFFMFVVVLFMVVLYCLNFFWFLMNLDVGVLFLDLGYL